MNKLNLTEENVIAIHETGHLISYLVGSIESAYGYRINTDKLSGLSIIEKEGMRGRLSIIGLDNVEFKDFVLLSGCMTVYFYYNPGSKFNAEGIKNFFDRTGGGDDIEELLKIKSIEEIKPQIEKLGALMNNPKYLKMVDSLSRDILEKKELSKRGLQRLSFRLHNEIKTVLDEEKKRGH